MTKIDGMTAAAVAFAGFAAWYALKGSGAKPSTGSAAADTVYGLMSTQRHDVGNNIGASIDYLGGASGLLPGSLTGSGSSYGLQAPKTGFWS